MIERNFRCGHHVMFLFTLLSLQSIYESIKKEPFKFPEDDGNDLMHTFFNPDKEGWLWKQGTYCSCTRALLRIRVRTVAVLVRSYGSGCVL